MFQKKGNEFQKRKLEKVKIVALNPFLDLALLKVEDPDLQISFRSAQE